MLSHSSPAPRLVSAWILRPAWACVCARASPLGERRGLGCTGPLRGGGGDIGMTPLPTSRVEVTLLPFSFSSISYRHLSLPWAFSLQSSLLATGVHVSCLIELRSHRHSGLHVAVTPASLFPQTPSNHVQCVIRGATGEIPSGISALPLCCLLCEYRPTYLSFLPRHGLLRPFSLERPE